MGPGCSFKGSEPVAKKFKVADLGFISSLMNLDTYLLSHQDVVIGLGRFVLQARLAARL